MTAVVFWARIGRQLIGKVDLREELPAQDDSIAVDWYQVGCVQGQLWARVAEVKS